MNKEIIERWERGKENLQNWFKTHNQEEYDDYEKVVSTLIKHCLNFGDCDVEISEKFEVSDHGHYQGTQIFLLHEDVYQPSSSNYYVFDNYYGSCSGCDTLLSISGYESGLPTDKQAESYMKLCLHMVQRMECLGDLLED